MSHRVINFYAGPAALPLPALERAQAELLDFENTGMSVMEISHRAKEYDAVHNEAIALVKELLAVPDNFKILLLQGGGNLQFAMLPMNILHSGRKADYIITGQWAKKAYKEAKIVAGDAARVIASTEEEKFARLPRKDEIKVNPDAAYVHFCSNNTIFGTQWKTFPDTGGIPLACDMSSDFMWRPFDVKPFGLIYAGAQKNLGPSARRGDHPRRLPRSARTSSRACCSTRSTPTRTRLYNTPPASRSTSCATSSPTTSRSAAWTRSTEQPQEGRAALRLHRHVPRVLQGARQGPDDRSYMNVDFFLPNDELTERS